MQMQPGADPELPAADREILGRAVVDGTAQRYCAAHAAVEELLRRHPGHNVLLLTRMQILHNSYDSEAAFHAARELALHARSDLAVHKALEVMLFWAPFVPGLAPGQAAALAAHWAARLAERTGPPLPPPGPPPPGPVPARRPLRVGYLSPAFGLAADYLPLALHDRTVVQPIAYAIGQQRLQPQTPVPRFDGFRDLSGRSDREAAALIRQDGIDILVDLGGSGHCQRNGILALRPARLQLGWSNKLLPQYPPLIDAVLGDEELFAAGDFAPPGAARLVRLPGPLCIVDETAPPPPPVPPPVLARGRVTIGSTASPYKVTGATLAAWAQVLHRLPGVRMVYAAQRVTDLFERKLCDGMARHGIGPDRFELRLRRESFGEMLNGIDLALDAIPFTSNFSCLQALRQGVPVVTLRGDRLPGRLASSLLHRIGRPELAAADLPAFVETAVALASDPERLRRYRTLLPAAVAAARLNDHRHTAACLEQAYLELWHTATHG